MLVLFLYFVVNADRSILVKGNEVFPAGTDIAKFILKQTKNLQSQIETGNGSYPTITDAIKPIVETVGIGASKLIPRIINKVKDLIREPIKNKIDATFCSVK